MKTDGRVRRNVTVGAEVLIVLKRDQRTGRLTRGVVKDILTRSANHPHGIKIRLRNGKVGRVKEVVALESRQDSTTKENADNHSF